MMRDHRGSAEASLAGTRQYQPAVDRQRAVEDCGIGETNENTGTNGLALARAECEDSVIARLRASALEDIARLNEILRANQCSAAIRSADQMALRPHCLMAPIYGSHGELLASLVVELEASDGPASSVRLLRGLVDSAARDISERWFRLIHRRNWIVAAVQPDVPDDPVVIAVDRAQRLVGACRRAREHLRASGFQSTDAQQFQALFRTGITEHQRHRFGDVGVRLMSRAGQPWIGLITPPDHDVDPMGSTARSLFHSRPRLASLPQLSASARLNPSRGLSETQLRHVQGHIEAALTSALEISELAGSIRLSSSQFIRAFKESVGVTPHRYVNSRRISRAQELLTTSGLALADIALAVGFADQSHFSRRFSEAVGVPPGVFRKRHESF